jgi:hypothetical protein
VPPRSNASRLVPKPVAGLKQNSCCCAPPTSCTGDAFIGEPTWSGLQRHYSTEQLLDIVFTVGQYNLVSMALNTCGVQLDSGMTLDPDLCKYQP